MACPKNTLISRRLALATDLGMLLLCLLVAGLLSWQGSPAQHQQCSLVVGRCLFMRLPARLDLCLAAAQSILSCLTHTCLLRQAPASLVAWLLGTA